MALQVFDHQIVVHGLCAIAGQPLGRRVANKFWLLRFGVINAYQPATCRGQPESAGMVYIDTRNRARRDTVLCAKCCEAPIVVARDLTSETDPNIAGEVFSEGSRLGAHGRVAGLC